MTKVTYVSKSRVDVWNTCKRKYFYQYIESIEPIKKARPLEFGNIFHKAEELDAKGKRWQRALRDCPDSLYDDAEIILSEYFNYYEELDQHINYLEHDGEVVIEKHIEMELEDNILFQGWLDGLSEIKDGVAIPEHKTSANPPRPVRWRDFQTALYAVMCDRLGLPRPTHILWNFVLSKPPTAPQINKDGSISTAKISTLPLKIVDTLEPLGYKPKVDCPELWSAAKENRKHYFIRKQDKINYDVANNIVNQMVQVAKEIHSYDAPKEEDTPMNIGRHCDWCPFEKICAAELTNGDKDFIKKHNFRTRQPRK